MPSPLNNDDKRWFWRLVRGLIDEIDTSAGKVNVFTSALLGLTFLLCAIAILAAPALPDVSASSIGLIIKFDDLELGPASALDVMGSVWLLVTWLCVSTYLEGKGK